MRGHPGEQGAGHLITEGSGEPVDGLQRPQSEACHQPAMLRQAQRPQQLVEQRTQVGIVDLDEPPPRPRVGAEFPRGGVAIVADAARAVPVEHVGQTDWRGGPGEAMGSEVEFGEGGGDAAQRMDRRAHVMADTRFEEFGGARAAADGVGGFDHEHSAAGAGQLRRGGQTVGPGSDDDGVEAARATR